MKNLARAGIDLYKIGKKMKIKQKMKLLNTLLH
jgi:hypothetical protein